MLDTMTAERAGAMSTGNPHRLEFQIPSDIRLNDILIEADQKLIDATTVSIVAAKATGPGKLTRPVPLDMLGMIGETLVPEDTAAFMTTITKGISTLILATSRLHFVVINQQPLIGRAVWPLGTISAVTAVAISATDG